MPRFFIDKNDFNENNIIIKGSQVNHIKNVLRKKIGEKIRVCDNSGVEYNTEIINILNDEIELVVLDTKTTNNEPKVKISLFQGLPKSDKFELIIQKSVELGINKIFPIITERTVVQINNDKVNKKVDRWNKISLAASKQSQRGKIPKVYLPQKISSLYDELSKYDLVIVPYENCQKKCLKDLLKYYTIDNTGNIAIVIGPEGGFSNNEIEFLEYCGAKQVTLGPRILRTETAAIAVLSIILYEMDGMKI